jgi:hypothetical protein
LAPKNFEISFAIKDPELAVRDTRPGEDCIRALSLRGGWSALSARCEERA